MTERYPADVLTAAKWWYDRGATVAPAATWRKGPRVKDWDSLPREELFGLFEPSDTNLALRTGDGGIADVDFDDDFAARVAPYFLPTTGVVYGRIGNPNSHRIYRCEDDERGYVNYKNPLNGSKLLELRADAQHATVVPPSTNTGNREAIQMVPGASLELCSVTFAALASACGRIAAVLVLRRYWPAEGSRGEAALALAGWLIMSGWEEEDACTFVEAVVADGTDDEPEKRVAGVRATARRHTAGDAITGRPRLAETLIGDGEKLTAALAGWLRLGKGSAAGEKHTGPESGNGSDEKQGRGPSIAAQLVELASAATFFHDTERQPYVTVPVGAHQETWRLSSGVFKNWLGHRLYTAIGKTANPQAMQEALSTLAGRALFDGPTLPVFVRLMSHEEDSAIYLDLANAGWEAIKITCAGWEIVSNPPVKFRRPKGMLPLPTPLRGGRLGALRPFVNLGIYDGHDGGDGRASSSWVLLVAFLLASLRPVGPFPILGLSGEQGSAKSTLARIIRMLIDPNVAALRSEPKDVRDLAIAANNAWMVVLDNISNIPAWLSDGLCRLSTGGGSSYRTLYENDEETLFDAQRPVIFTGIEEVGTKPDLLDRSILLSLPSIPEARRRPESAFWADFAAAHPCILGALLDAVSGALAALPTTTLASHPRMADFALWVTAAETALTWKPGTFLAAYTVNRADANDLALDASLVAGALLKFIQPETTWTGTMAELHAALLKSDATLAEKPGWPKHARGLAGAIKRVATNLRTVGFRFSEQRLTRSRLHTIQRDPEKPSQPSQPSPEGATSESISPESMTVASADDGSTVIGAANRHTPTPEMLWDDDGHDGYDGSVPSSFYGRYHAEWEPRYRELLAQNVPKQEALYRAMNESQAKGGAS